MEELLEVKLWLTQKQLEVLCEFIGEQHIGHTKWAIKDLGLTLNPKEVDGAFYDLYCQLSDRIGIDVE